MDINAITQALEVLKQARMDASESVWPVRRILMHAEDYVEKQFKQYFEE